MGLLVSLSHVECVATPFFRNDWCGAGENKPLGRDRRVDNSAVERPLSGSSSGSGPSKMKNSGDYIGEWVIMSSETFARFFE